MCDATEDDHSYFFVRLKTSPPPKPHPRLSKGEEPPCDTINILSTFKKFAFTSREIKEPLSNILKNVQNIGDLSPLLWRGFRRGSYVRISFLLKNQTAPPNKTPICASKIYRLFLMAGQFSILPFMGTLSSSIAM